MLSVHTDFFTGDLLATGLQNCGLPGQTRGRSGLDLWNVTDARHPVHLGFFGVAPATGVHEVSLTKRVIGRKERIFALAAVPFSEVVTTLFSGRTVGDFQLIDVTDPRNPRLADDWGAGKDGGLPFGSPLFGLPAPFDCSPPTGLPPRQLPRDLRPQRLTQQRRQDRLPGLLGRGSRRPRHVASHPRVEQPASRSSPATPGASHASGTCPIRHILGT